MRFGDDYQREVLGRLHLRSFLVRVGDQLRPDVFDPAYEPVVKEVAGRWRKGSVLSAGQLKQLAHRHEVSLKILEDNGDREFDREELSRFCVYRVLRDSLAEAHVHVERGDWEKAIRSVNDARRAFPSISNGHVGNILESNEEMPRREKTIKVGLEKIDTALKGGPGAGDLAMVMAPTSGGKTSWLVNVACTAAEQGWKVHYVTLEVPRREIEAKARRRLTGVEEPGRSLWRKAADKLKRKVKLLVGEHAPGSISPDALEQEVADDIDLLVVDYADYLMPPGRDAGFSYYDLGEIYTGLKRVALNRHITIWTATQVNRASYGNDRLEVDAVESSLKKAMLVDIAVSINQSPAERAPDERTGTCTGSIYLAKNRHGPRYIDADVTIHWPTCRFTAGRRV